MLYDPRWQTNADLSLVSLIAWLEQQPAKQTYPYADPKNCMLAKWLQSMDPKAHSRPIGEGTFAYQFRGERVYMNHFRNIAIPQERIWRGCSCCSFGAALERARAVS